MPGLLSTRAIQEFAEAVRASLSKSPQREIPSRYLYDDVGTELFEAITLLPEYGLTRADERILQQHAEEILNGLLPPIFVTELGSGGGRKTRWILEALQRRQPATYFPIDISGTALDRCRKELLGLGAIGIVGLEKSYLEGLREIAAHRRPGQTMLLLFLGSAVGNFERPAEEAFLRKVRRCLKPGDGLLLGTDLVKPGDDLLLAYDDPAGVTAAFNLNVLARINRELGGDFLVRNFKHEARWNGREQRIEMHLRSMSKQSVSIREARFTFTLEEGETIWTEACHKFVPEELPLMAARAGFVPRAAWVDEIWPFAESLWVAA